MSSEIVTSVVLTATIDRLAIVTLNGREVYVGRDLVEAQRICRLWVNRMGQEV